MAVPVTKIDITLLKENPDNPRIITAAKFEALVASVKNFPQMLEARPIAFKIASDGTRLVLGGNMRLRACIAAGMTEVPVIDLSGLTDAQQREFIIKDNVGFGEWEWDRIIADWPEAPGWGLDIPEWAIAKPEAVEDDYEIPGDLVTDIVLGDLFEIGPHRLLCGDSTKAEDVGRLMGEERWDMIFTDPPYGVNYAETNAAKSSRSRSRSEITGDEMKVSQISEAIWSPSFKNLYDFAKNDCSFYMTMCQGGDQMMMMMMMMMSQHWQVKHELIWVKSSPVFSMGRLDYDYKHEPIIYGWKKKHNFYGRGEFTKSVWEIPKPSKSEDHPTTKPVQLVANALNNSSKEKDLIGDLFLGSGTTMVAAHQLNRKCYGIEIDPKYCQVIVDRMRKLAPEIVIIKNGVPLPNEHEPITQGAE